MFINSLFLIALNCKQPKCPPNSEWLKKEKILEHLYNEMQLGNKTINGLLMHSITWMTQKCNRRQRNPNTNEYIRYDYIYFSKKSRTNLLFKKQIYCVTESIHNCQCKIGGCGLPREENQGSFGSDENI